MSSELPASVSVVDGTLGPSAVTRRFLASDQSVALQRLDDGVEGAVAEFDALLLVTLAHRRRHLVRVHWPLEQQGQHRKRERAVRVLVFGHGIIGSRISGHGYTAAIRRYQLTTLPQATASALGGQIIEEAKRSRLSDARVVTGRRS